MVGGEECRFGHPHLHRLVAVAYWQGMKQGGGGGGGGEEEGKREGVRREKGREEGGRKEKWREKGSKQVHKELLAATIIGVQNTNLIASLLSSPPSLPFPSSPLLLPFHSAEKYYAMARDHFLYSGQPEKYGTMLVEFATSKGYAGEAELFITQAVLQ